MELHILKDTYDMLKSEVDKELKRTAGLGASKNTDKKQKRGGKQVGKQG